MRENCAIYPKQYPMTEEQKLTNQSIRSFVVRNGRITAGQIRALENHGPKYNIAFQEHIFNWSGVFSRSAPLWIEIGFGNGSQTAHIAAMYPNINVLGIEIHLPGVGQLLNLVEKNSLCNLRIIRHDAIEVLQQCIEDNTLERVLLFFPDPWPKKKHHKRRIVQKIFVQLITEKLKPGGYLHMATDWEEYAQWMLEHLSANAKLKNCSTEHSYISSPDYRLLTKFERRGIEKGHGVWDLMFQKL